MRGRVAMWALLWGAVVVGCEQGETEPERPVVVAGETVSPETLKEGEFYYRRWCAGCHGPHGRGRGPRAGAADRPPPDFTRGQWRHVEVEQGELPPDPHIRRVVREGIDGTLMTPMRVPEEQLDPVITYVKYLATR